MLQAFFRVLLVNFSCCVCVATYSRAQREAGDPAAPPLCTHCRTAIERSDRQRETDRQIDNLTDLVDVEGVEGGGDLVRVRAVKALQRRAEYVLIIKQ